MSVELLPDALLSRKAIVYVRQSTQTQVQTNLESQRRQYDLVEVARRHGFASVEVIDDLGRSASGSVARPGFDRLVATVCAGEVGAVLCLDASQLARNGRDWYHLLELCGLVGARVIDADGIYDPHRPNDRLLLGMKGSISEFELGVIRARMLDAKHSKALRGDLRISVPILNPLSTPAASAAIGVTDTFSSVAKLDTVDLKGSSAVKSNAAPRSS